MIAVITMLIDHTAASILERMLQIMPAWGPITMANWDNWYRLDVILRGIGRMAFPIYCFLLVEGFIYTHSKAKYALRLFIFALISEIPFDMALFKSYWDMSHNNVFFTLWIGLLTIWATDFVMVHMAYGMSGICAIYVLYMLRNQRQVGFATAVVLLGIMSGTLELLALLMLIPMHFYNGTRGKQHKYFFYAFYPVHLLFLAIICQLIGLGVGQGTF